MNKLNKSYISELDIFLEDIIKKNTVRSASQKNFIQRYKEIIAKRDKAVTKQNIIPIDFFEE